MAQNRLEMGQVEIKVLVSSIWSIQKIEIKIFIKFFGYLLQVVLGII